MPGTDRPCGDGQRAGVGGRVSERPNPGRTPGREGARSKGHTVGADAVPPARQTSVGHVWRRRRGSSANRLAKGDPVMSRNPFGNLGNMMKQAQAMQEQLAKVQEQAAGKTVE